MVPCGESDDHRSSMSTLIMDHLYASIIITHNDNWPTSHAGTKVIAAVSDLALMP